jgi:predicted small integral membrane protein
MPLRPALLAAIAGAAMSACVVVPVTTADYDPDCQLVTHHMTLQTVQLAQFNRCSGQGCEMMLLAAFGVTAASAIVSGSIAVIGNVAYWAERRAGCVAPLAPVG